jgi:MoaA/NifB/PqqE/SkfB family radical SAM enzyme
MAFKYLIDIVGGCNLACPSCPVGNSTEAARPSGAMSVDLFKAIIAKIRADQPRVRKVALYNWTEPMLHPRLPQFIDIVHGAGLKVDISSNLNIAKHLEPTIGASPDGFRVSISGFSQETYERTHLLGDVEVVKHNMRDIREAIDRTGAKTRVEVCYHCYVDNIGSEYQEMERLARELDFDFSPVWAYLMPIEKVLDRLNGVTADEDRAVIDLLAIKPEEQRDLAIRRPAADCRLRAKQTVINCDGSVPLCCTVFDSRYTIAPSFLDQGHEELQRSKYEHPLCTECMGHGLHETFAYRGADEWHPVAQRRVAPQGVPKELGPSVGRRWKGAIQRTKKRIAAFGREDSSR